MAISFRDHLLPKSATLLERALSAVAARLLDATHNVIRAVWDADRCPVHILPYLAQAWSVDEWDPAWSEAEKRQAIRDAIWLHRHKGTVGALKRALAQMGMPVTVSEWFRHGGAPYTFRLSVTLADGAAWTAEHYRRLLRVAIGAKNVRSHLDRIAVAPPPIDTPLAIGIAARTRIRVVNIIAPETAIAARMTLHAGLGARVRVSSTVAPA